MKTVNSNLPLSHQMEEERIRARKDMSQQRARPLRRATGYIFGFALLAAALTFRSGVGINVPIVFGLALAIGFWRKPAKLYQLGVQVQLVAWCAVAIAFIVHLNDYTAVSFYLSTLILLGTLSFRHAPNPLNAFHAGISLIVGMFPSGIRSMMLAIAAISADRGSFSFKRLGKASFSLLLVFTIGSLYVASNTLLSSYWAKLAVWLQQFNVFTDALLFLLVALLWSFLASLVVYKRKAWKTESRFNFFEAKTSSETSSETGWSNAAIALLALNILALVLNIVDGYTTWLGETSTSGAELKRGVHIGTYTLITAIIVASGYLLSIQRRMPADRDRVSMLASAWLGQNFLMVLTVALRNYHYTHAYGLTYKRIGVWLFLICCITGLYFLNQRLREGSTFRLLLKRQSWAVYLVLSLATIPHWPGLITRYNLADARFQQDFQYLGSLLPYNYVQWKVLSVDENSPTTKSFKKYSKARMKYYIHPLDDWREWDVAQMQLNRHFSASKTTN